MSVITFITTVTIKGFYAATLPTVWRDMQKERGNGWVQEWKRTEREGGQRGGGGEMEAEDSEREIRRDGDGWWECVFIGWPFNKTLQHDVIVREQLHLYVQYHSVNMDHSTAVAVQRTALTCLTLQHPHFLSLLSLSSPPLLFSALKI